MNNPSALRVTCAVIERDGHILAAQRSKTMSLPLKWEFPGGKVGEGETPETCLVREIREEMGVDVEILRSLPASPYRYADKAIALLPLVCRIAGGSIELLEHKEISWGDLWISTGPRRTSRSSGLIYSAGKIPRTCSHSARYLTVRLRATQPGGGSNSSYGYIPSVVDDSELSVTTVSEEPRGDGLDSSRKAGDILVAPYRFEGSIVVG